MHSSLLIKQAFLDDLRDLGPHATPKSWSYLQASGYCWRLAKSHYENFSVATWLFPRAIRPHVAHIYAYCRWADDLADEVGDSRQSSALLDWWQSELTQCFAGQATHPVFVALAVTIRQFQLSQQPLLDLLVAFKRDQQQSRYATVAELESYCRCSANPVGQMVLELAGARTPQTDALSNSICTGLQWANFCQDVAIDFARGRVYLPQESLSKHGAEESALSAGRFSPAWGAVLQEEVARARRQLIAGLPLCSQTPRWLGRQVTVFVAGGFAILDAIERARYDVWTRRTRVTGWQKLGILARACLGRSPKAALP